MQLVQTVIRLLPPSTFARTGRRFTFHRRLVLLLACETLFPNCGPLPQRSHLAAMVLLQSLVFFVAEAGGRAVESQATIHLAGAANRRTPRCRHKRHSALP